MDPIESLSLLVLLVGSATARSVSPGDDRSAGSGGQGLREQDPVGGHGDHRWPFPHRDGLHLLAVVPVEPQELPAGIEDGSRPARRRPAVRTAMAWGPRSRRVWLSCSIDPRSTWATRPRSKRDTTSTARCPSRSPRPSRGALHRPTPPGRRPLRPPWRCRRWNRRPERSPRRPARDARRGRRGSARRCAPRSELRSGRGGTPRWTSPKPTWSRPGGPDRSPGGGTESRSDVADGHGAPFWSSGPPTGSRRTVAQPRDVTQHLAGNDQGPDGERSVSPEAE